MSNIIQSYEDQQIQKLTSKKSIPTFRSGDTIKVTLKIVEGDRSRFQAFEGMCIARKNNSLNSKFTLRKVSHGEGVERVFPLFGPNIEKIEVVRKGSVKRAKLYFLRNRKGKGARIADRDRGDEIDEYSMSDNSSSFNEEVKNTPVENSEEKELPQQKNKEVKKELSNEPTKETVAEEKKSLDKKSKSTASEAAKTEDELQS